MCKNPTESAHEIDFNDNCNCKCFSSKQNKTPVPEPARPRRHTKQSAVVQTAHEQDLILLSLDF